MEHNCVLFNEKTPVLQLLLYYPTINLEFSILPEDTST